MSWSDSGSFSSAVGSSRPMLTPWQRARYEHVSRSRFSIVKETSVMAAKKKTEPAAEGLVPPAGGAIVRMYRIGHGDCFLIAFDGDTRPVHVLIDCGYKPGSPDFIEAKPTDPDDVVADIKAV